MWFPPPHWMEVKASLLQRKDASSVCLLDIASDISRKTNSSDQILRSNWIGPSPPPAWLVVTHGEMRCHLYGQGMGCPSRLSLTLRHSALRVVHLLDW